MVASSSSKQAAAASSSSSASKMKKPSSKSSAVGTPKKASAVEDDGDVVLKHSKPFGQEGSDDEDVDIADSTFATAPMEDDDDLMIGTSSPAAPSASAATPAEASGSKPSFAPISASAASSLTAVAKGQLRKIPIPPHRLTPLKNEWHKIYTPLVEMASLQVRMNVAKKCVELKSSRYTQEQGMLQKGADFVKAFALGFDADDAIALLRMDDLFIDTFEIKDVKTLQGDNLSRAIGRIAGKDGRTRFAIENASRTRLVVADTKIHILGNFGNIKIARDAVVALIRGSPPGKVYANLKTIGARQRQRA
ncbi:K Homology domain protein [Kalmanozyma brasiliensis GHG001]|uniref:Pre-rRNA-processing protein PNO1 n=1 Tax=Kalmanozyma brasiliensis (strain GHG001) TaxID=1365824 RepID=V5F2A0_KALBG|nr:K Homology domain protein [Kalmanozyma brasiliensis GHG001]EST09514.1 K Homology domain protein [Kalmanozyma brasiliensis GHG001]